MEQVHRMQISLIKQLHISNHDLNMVVLGCAANCLGMLNIECNWLLNKNVYSRLGSIDGYFGVFHCENRHDVWFDRVQHVSVILESVFDVKSISNCFEDFFRHIANRDNLKLLQFV